MARWKSKAAVLTMAQRLTLSQLRPGIVTRGGWSPVERSLAEIAVLPCRPIRLGDQPTSKTPGWPDRVEKQLAGQVTVPAALRGPRGSLPAVAVEGLRRTDAGAVARAADVDACWHSGDDGLAVTTTDTDRLPERDHEDTDAAAGGSSLMCLLETGGLPEVVESVVSWTTSARPGWRSGGYLGAACDICGASLQWFDWWHSSAAHMRSSWLLVCPAHGAVPWERRTAPPLIQTRRQLDSALWANQASEAATHDCYVFRLHGLEPDAVYVGETWHTPQERWAQHRDGIKAAKELSKKGVTIGDLELDLLPELPPLPSRSAARAAEQWCAAVLAHRGLVVYGGH